MNENPADGCECAFVSDIDYPDGVDTNCDSVDGGVNIPTLCRKTEVMPGLERLTIRSLPSGSQ